jgi:hypothetical protein
MLTGLPPEALAAAFAAYQRGEFGTLKPTLSGEAP